MEKLTPTQQVAYNECKAYNEFYKNGFILNGVKYTPKNGRYYSDNGYGKVRIAKQEYEAECSNRAYAEVYNGEVE